METFPDIVRQDTSNSYYCFSVHISADSLFYTRGEVLYLNQTVLAGRALDRCEYKAITWESDSYYSFSEPLVRKEPPFEMKVKHDFFKIECFLKTDKSTAADENKYNVRRLLQLGNNIGRRDNQLNRESAQYLVKGERLGEQRVQSGRQDMPPYQGNTQNVKPDVQNVGNVPHSNRNIGREEDLQSANIRAQQASQYISGGGKTTHDAQAVKYVGQQSFKQNSFNAQTKNMNGDIAQQVHRTVQNELEYKDQQGLQENAGEIISSQDTHIMKQRELSDVQNLSHQKQQGSHLPVKAASSANQNSAIADTNNKLVTNGAATSDHKALQTSSATQHKEQVDVQVGKTEVIEEKGKGADNEHIEYANNDQEQQYEDQTTLNPNYYDDADGKKQQ